MKVIIDRFEEDYAICEKEDLSIIDIPKSKIPQDAVEGDILTIEEDNISVDVEATKARRAEIENLFNS